MALFGIITGVAFLLTGIGFGVLVLFGALGGREPRLQLFGKRRPEASGTKSVPVA